jgi:CHAT domain-containing protein
VERFRLVQVDSGRDLLAPVAGRATGPVAVLAAPSFASAPAAVVLAGMPRLRSAGLHALPAARLEGQAVAQAAGPGAADVAAGWEATEAWLRERRQPRWLHLATHAFVLPPPDPFSAEAEWLWEPMERAAIALAGAGDTLAAWYRGDRPAAESDGVLTAAEVGRLDLRGTELVVVSACDSAAGAESNAEGVLGLGRGFFRAGARQVMLSLAPVEDEETAEFMTAFYGRLAAGETPVEALNRVQRERIERARRAGAPVPHLQAGPWILGMRGGL